MPTLNRRLRGADPDKRSIIFRALERILRADPGLSGIENLQWRSWVGTPEDTMDYTPATCPLISLNYVDLDNDLEAEALYRINFGTRIECATEGTCIDDSIDLWGMVEKALVSTKTTLEGKTVQQYLRDAVTVTNPGNSRIMPAGLFTFRLTKTGIYGQRPRGDDGVYKGPMNLMIGSGMFTGQTVKPA